MIYMITRVRKFEKMIYGEPNEEKPGRLFKRMVTETSCVGYHETLDAAKNAVVDDSGGLSDCRWPYVVIESVPPGCYGYLSDDDSYQQYWYVYAGERNWVPCDVPDEFKNTLGFFV